MQWSILFIIGCLKLTLSEPTVRCCSEARCRCNDHVTGLFVDCSRLGLDSSPKFISSVVSVNLSYNFLTDFPDISSVPRKLEHLDLSGNLITDIATDRAKALFASFVNLQTLNVSSNLIPLDGTVYQTDIFVNLTTLTDLNISNNTLTGNVFDNLDVVFRPLTALTRLSIDSAETYVFGEGFSELKNLTFLKLQGLCQDHRLREIPEQYFQHLPRLEVLDISGTLHWNLWNVSSIDRCSLYYIHKGAIAKLTKLTYFDMSYNRGLGLCGFRNISQDLRFTEIKTLKASFLNCDGGNSETLFCDDIIPLSNTSLEILYFDGNNIAFGQTGILYYLPSSLQFLSIRNNRWVRSRYAYCNLRGLRNLTNIDISHMNEDQISHDNTAFPFCETFWRNVNCEHIRTDGRNTTLIPDEHNDGCVIDCMDYRHTGSFIYEQGVATNNHSNRINHTYPLTCDMPLDPLFIRNGNVNYFQVPPNIQNITLNGSRLGYTLSWTFFSTDTIQSLTISDNHFYSIAGPICNATNLRFLDISNNKCSQLSNYIFTDLYALEYLFLDNNLIGYSDIVNDKLVDRLFASQTQLRVLSLTSNMISFLPENLFLNVVSLQILKLNRNLFTDWNLKILHLQNLELLDLSDNQILYLSDRGMNLIDDSVASNLTIDLSHNPFLCNCDSLPFIKWILHRSGRFRNFRFYNCIYRNSKRDLSSAKMYLDKDCNSYISVIIVSSILLMTFVLFLVMISIYKNRWKLRYWYYIAKRRYLRGYEELGDDPGDDNRYHFDAFISYADEDRLFVKQEMIEVLENREGFRLCIHHRNFIPGSDIADNIINAIHQSQKVIFVISEAFLNSSWCMYELNMAHTEYVVSRRGQNMLILFFKEHVNLNRIPEKILQITREETYLEYPENNDNLYAFWAQLIDAIT